MNGVQLIYKMLFLCWLLSCLGADINAAAPGILTGQQTKETQKTANAHSNRADTHAVEKSRSRDIQLAGQVSVGQATQEVGQGTAGQVLTDTSVNKKSISLKMQAVYAACKQKLAAHYRAASSLLAAAVLGYAGYKLFGATDGESSERKSGASASAIDAQSGHKSNNKQAGMGASSSRGTGNTVDDNSGIGDNSGSGSDNEHVDYCAIDDKDYVKEVSADIRKKQNKLLLQAYNKDDLAGMIAALNAGADGKIAIDDPIGFVEWYKEQHRYFGKILDTREAGNTLLMALLQKKVDEQVNNPKRAYDAMNFKSAVFVRPNKLSAEVKKSRENDYRELVRLCIKRGADVHTTYTVTYTQEDGYGNSKKSVEHTYLYDAFAMAIETGDVTIVNMFVKADPSLVCTQAHCIEVDLSQNFCSRRYKPMQQTPLMMVVNQDSRTYEYNAGKELIAQALLNAGADYNECTQDKQTVLMLAAEKNMGEVVKQLLAYHDISVNAVTKTDKTALMYAAEEGAAEIVQALIDAGADVHAKDRYRGTAFDYAVRDRYSVDDAVKAQELHAHVADITRCLLAAGATVNTEYKLGEERHYDEKNTFINACHNGHVEAARHILMRNGSIDARLCEQLAYSITHSSQIYTGVFELLYECENAGVYTIEQELYNTLLKRLVGKRTKMDNQQLIELLDADDKRHAQNNGCAVLSKAVTPPSESRWDVTGDTLLMWALDNALEYQREKIDEKRVSGDTVRRLISMVGVNGINAKNSIDKTALKCAVGSYHDISGDMVAALVQAGAVLEGEDMLSSCLQGRTDAVAGTKMNALLSTSMVTQDMYNNLVEKCIRKMPIELVRLLLAHDQQLIDESGGVKNLPLFHTSLVKRGSLFAKQEDLGYTVMQCAVEANRDDIVQLLLDFCKTECEKASMIQAVDDKGNPVLALAVLNATGSLLESDKDTENQRHKIAQVLVGAKADIHACTHYTEYTPPDWKKESASCSVLEYAVNKASRDMVKALIKGRARQELAADIACLEQFSGKKSSSFESNVGVLKNCLAAQAAQIDDIDERSEPASASALENS